MQGSPVQFEFEDLSPVEKRLKVEVARDHVAGRLSEAYKKLSREVNLRGFRKGKAPRELLEKMFRQQVESEVTQELLRDTLTYIAQNAQLRLIGQPVLEAMPEVRKNESLRYSARIELFPQIDLTEYEGVEVNKRAAKIDEEMVEKLLERKRADHTELVPIEGRTTAGPSDTLSIALSGQVADHTYDNDEWNVDMGNPRSGPVPGFIEALSGIALDAADQEVKLTLPEGIRPDLAGKELTFKVTVRQAYEKRLPELDDEFAKDTGEAETLEELRAKIRASLLKEDEEEIKGEVRDAILDEVVKRNPVPLPPSLLKQFTDQVLQSHRQRAFLAALQQGQDPKAEGVVDEAALREEASSDAVRQLSKEFVLVTLAEKEKIDVTQADVEKRLSEMARHSDKSVQRIRAEAQKEDPQLDQLRTSIRLEKALDLLESRAKIVEAGS